MKSVPNGARDAREQGEICAEDVHDTLAPIEESEFKLYDVAVHGYGSG